MRDRGVREEDLAKKEIGIKEYKDGAIQCCSD